MVRGGGVNPTTLIQDPSNPIHAFHSLLNGMYLARQGKVQ